MTWRFVTIFPLIVALTIPAFGQVPTLAPGPVTDGKAILDCDVVALEGNRTKASIELDYTYSTIWPSVTVMSSDETVISSMPYTASQAEPNSLGRYTALQTGEGSWQLLRFEILSSASDRAQVKFFEQTRVAPYYGELLNSLSAIGICKVSLEAAS